METEPARVLIVEDDDDLRESIREFLSISGYGVTAVANGKGFYHALDNGEYNVALIDIGLPDQSGLVLAQYLRANTQTGIIILTARDTDQDQIDGYQSGADLYLTKPVASKVLASAIVRLLERLPNASPQGQVLQRQDLNVNWLLNRQSWTLLLDGENLPIQLTSLEFRFLELLAISHGTQVTREHLVEQLYQQTDDYSGRALDAMVRRLRAKISKRSDQPTPIKSIYGVGYCFTGNISIR